MTQLQLIEIFRELDAIEQAALVADPDDLSGLEMLKKCADALNEIQYQLRKSYSLTRRLELGVRLVN